MSRSKRPALGMSASVKEQLADDYDVVSRARQVVAVVEQLRAQ
jgi:hypothetical protein